MLTRIRIQGYRCLRDVELKLGKMHALVGPNDSGKSSVLRAIAAFDCFSAGDFGAVRSTLGPQRTGDPEIVLESDLGPMSVVRHRIVNGSVARELAKRPGSPQWEAVGGNAPLPGSKGGSTLVRFDPDAMREAHAVAPESMLRDLVQDRGRGLPAVYDWILGRGDDCFSRIAERFRELFPSVKNLRVQAIADGNKSLSLVLADGTVVPAEGMSDGMFYYLGFAALEYLGAARHVLIEEPENGLHPSRIADVVRVLRAFTDSNPDRQVIMTTHSPLVLNELRADEVTVVTRDATTGTKLTPLAETPNFAERSKVYALGELWLSYANGVDEAPLFRAESAAE